MFVVCGEALMDVFAADTTPTGMQLDARVGGSPFNVAVGLARLAQPVSFLGALSSGFLGDRLLAALQQEGVLSDAVQRVDAPTTIGLVGLDASGVPSYSFYGAGCADRLLATEALTSLPSQIDAINIGSYATVVEPIASTLRTLIERESSRTLIAYDPNIRLNVEPELQPWRDTLNWMLPRCHLLKISDEDLHLLLPGVGVEEFAAEALGQGVALVIVTGGAAGATAWTSQVKVRAAPVKVDVVDTVGAGDTFQAGVLTWLAEHDKLSAASLGALTTVDLQSMLNFAAAAAAITCSRRGADMPRRNELD